MKMDASETGQAQRDYLHELNVLKLQRSNQLPLKSHSIKKRFYHRFQELIKKRILLKTMRYHVNKAFKKMRNHLHRHFWQRIRVLQSAKKHQVRYAVYLGGGLGDALVGSRFIRDFQQALDHVCTFDVYFVPNNCKSALLFQSIKGFEKGYTLEISPAAVSYYDFTLKVIPSVVLVDDRINYHVLEKRCPEVLKRLDHLKMAQKEIDYFLARGWNGMGLFSDWSVKQQQKCYNYLHALMDIPYGGHAMSTKVDERVLERFGLQSKKFMTIHDGWHVGKTLTRSRPTKALPLEIWIKIVQQIKAKRPDLLIVQLGANTGHDIPGVDMNLKNKLSLDESISVLAHSALHLDVESGLVHLGTAVGTRSVVMFGPTNLDWFGYPENINIPPKQCGNCWQVTENWMDACPLKMDDAVCMSSVDATAVTNHVLEALS